MATRRLCSVCKEPLWRGLGRGSVYQLDRSGNAFHPSCGARTYKTPIKEVHIGLDGQVLKGGYGRLKVHYGLAAPRCYHGMPRRSISHVLSLTPAQVTCKKCKAAMKREGK